MNNLWIDLNEKYQKYKSIIWIGIAIVVFFLLVMANLDKTMNSVGDSGNKTAISESVSTDDETLRNIVNNTISNENITSYEDMLNSFDSKSLNYQNTVELFILLCNANKTDVAYDMLSDECKQLIYPSKASFVNGYYSGIFKTKKNYVISNFKGNTYKVTFTEDAISTGGATGSAAQEYITVLSGGKINISKLVEKQELSIKSTNPYFSAEITGKTIYVDYEVYDIKIKNIVKADVYINQTMNSNLYLKNSSGTIYSIKTDDYIDVDYLIPSGSTKTMKVKFLKKYNDNTEIESMNFNSIRISNKNYYDYDTNQYITTNYPEEYEFSMEM